MTVNCDQATRFRRSVYGFRFIYLAVTESLVPAGLPCLPPSSFCSYASLFCLSSFVVRNDKGILFDERVYPPPSLLTKFIIMFRTTVRHPHCDYPPFLNGDRCVFCSANDNENANPTSSIVRLRVYEVNITVSAVGEKLAFHRTKNFP